MSDLLRLARIAIPLGLLAGVIVAALAAGCGGSEGDAAPTLPPNESLIPSPPTNAPTFDPYWTPEGWTPGPTPVMPTSVEISGVVIPIPAGSWYAYGAGGDARPVHMITLAESSIEFDNSGLTLLEVAPGDESAFGPTLDQLWELTKSVATASSGSVTIDGQQVPIPHGSYFSTLGSPANPDTTRIYIIRLPTSVVILDKYGIGYSSIAPEDKAKLAPTIDAAHSLTLPG